MRINLCIIDEGDARDKVTYQKSVERRNNIRCDWLVRTSNYTNCNQNHTLIMKNLDHTCTWRLEEIQCYQSLREFLSCYIWNCIVSSPSLYFRLDICPSASISLKFHFKRLHALLLLPRCWMIRNQASKKCDENFEESDVELKVI